MTPSDALMLLNICDKALMMSKQSVETAHSTDYLTFVFVFLFIVCNRYTARPGCTISHTSCSQL